ncbi:MAG: hypothetical protein ACYTDT_04495 [Planctomycetota bacterium]
MIRLLPLILILLTGCGLKLGIIDSENSYAVDASELVDPANPWHRPILDQPDKALVRIQIDNFEDLRTSSEVSLFVTKSNGTRLFLLRDYHFPQAHEDRTRSGQLFYAMMFVPPGRVTVTLVDGLSNNFCEFQADVKSKKDNPVIYFTLKDESITARH